MCVYTRIRIYSLDYIVIHFSLNTFLILIEDAPIGENKVSLAT